MSKIKDILVEKLDMPYELFNDDVKLTIYGKKRIVIERHNGIVVYRDNEIKLGCSYGIVKIEGEDMTIKNYGKDDIILDGKIGGVSFEEI